MLTMHKVSKTFESYIFSQNFFNFTYKFVINQKAKSLKTDLASNIFYRRGTCYDTSSGQPATRWCTNTTLGEFTWRHRLTPIMRDKKTPRRVRVNFASRSIPAVQFHGDPNCNRRWQLQQRRRRQMQSRSV